MKNTDILSQFYDSVLGVPSTWKTVNVTSDEAHKKVVVRLEYNEELHCPKCKALVKVYDHRIRRLRHLDTCDFETILEVNVPRIECPDCGVQQLPVEFAEKHSEYTQLFEIHVIDWLQSMTTKAVSEKVRLSWDAVDGIMQRAVKRGLKRRKIATPKAIGIDETSFRKRHDHITTVIDKDSGNVLEVLPDRDAETVKNWVKCQEVADFSTVQSISMDMSGSFIKAVTDIFESAGELICFDRFHVSQLFNKALDKVRRAECIKLAMAGTYNPLKKIKFNLLTNSNRTDNRNGKRKNFLSITRMHLKTSRAWQMKETASTLWDYEYMGAAEKNWKALLQWMTRSRIPEMKQLSKTIKKHLYGILNAVRMKMNNAILESKNSIIQRIKKMACGFRNKSRFRTAILFHLGGLDMSFPPL
jgi:transposase